MSTGLATTTPLVSGATSEESSAIKLPVAFTLAETWRTCAATAATVSVAGGAAAAGSDLAEALELDRPQPAASSAAASAKMRDAALIGELRAAWKAAPEFLPAPTRRIGRRLLHRLRAAPSRTDACSSRSERPPR